MISTRSVYVAGPSSEFRRVQRFSLEVRGMGWNLTHPWWEEYLKLEAEERPESSLTREDLLTRADQDFEGVALAGLIIVLAPVPGHYTKNTWIELGFAFALRRLTESPQIWIVGELPERRFFSWKADRHFDTEGECLSALVSGGA